MKKLVHYSPSLDPRVMKAACGQDGERFVAWMPAVTCKRCRRAVQTAS